VIEEGNQPERNQGDHDLEGGKSRSGRIIFYLFGKLGLVKRDCWKFKREQHEKKETNKNNNTKKNNVIATNSEILIILSYEDACLYNSTHDSDWMLKSRASYHATASKEKIISYKSSYMVKIPLGNNSFCNIYGVGDVLIKKEDG
jgi:hypothetical protein